jgi:phosphate transport system permease protein
MSKLPQPVEKEKGTLGAAIGERSLRRRSGRRTSLMAHGEPWIWVTGGALSLALLMIVSLLLLVLWQGSTTFWPGPLYALKTAGGASLLGEEFRSESFRPTDAYLDDLPSEKAEETRRKLVENEGRAHRTLLRTGNFDLTGTHFTWVSDFEVAEGDRERPPWAVVVERMAWGRFYGSPKAFLIDGEEAGSGPKEAWEEFGRRHARVRELWASRRRLEIHDIGRVNRKLEAARLKLRAAEIAQKPPPLWMAAYNVLGLVQQGGTPEEIGAAREELKAAERDAGRPAPAFLAAVAEFEAAQKAGRKEFSAINGEIAALNREMARYQIVMTAIDGQEKTLALAEIVRAYPANRLGFFEKLLVYLSRWWEFLTADPREANSEGGVFPAIFGTVSMTLIMSLAVVPFGVLAALYLREYAKAGPLVSAVRIAVNNLAGVPSIVFGVFGLGFFCYIIGGTIDQLFYEAKLPSPTFGTGGLIWASLTLALLTLPVVIVATEEALAAVPSSMREGSYACGASKWQTIRRIVLPRAMPGIMTGMILAMARGAGEVAPLMLVGAVKLAPELPVDTVFPYVHPERSFMHLGFHIYDLGFQSQNSEAAKPMVFTTTLLLIAIIAALNISAVWLRTRLRRRYLTSQF